ncbi:hypothetical protein GJAV_G00093990 [Gymnothorax javanicus]|nr:hypothetical protein GJAV_G00093990 [Gymnothorax javanicus]
MQRKSSREEGRRERKVPEGVGRTLVYSKQATPKLYQAKAVPVVPPKPQQCKLTALTLRQQREREQGREGQGERDGGRPQQRKDGETHEQKRRDRDGDGGNEGQSERWRDEDGRSPEKEMRRNSGASLCFDKAVALATEKRGRERERGRDGQTESRNAAERD